MNEFEIKIIGDSGNCPLQDLEIYRIKEEIANVLVRFCLNVKEIEIL
jgi:hypothetical protein